MASYTPPGAGGSRAEFLLFPNLPPELRLKIFNLALTTPRIIPFTLRPDLPAILQRLHPNTTLSAPLPPALLHTNHESRACALRIYTFYPLTETGGPDGFINPATDYLLLTDRETFAFAHALRERFRYSEELARKLRHLAMPLATWESFLKHRYEDAIIQLLKTFPSLEEIVLVVGEMGQELKGEDGKFVPVKAEEVPRSPELVGLCVRIFQPWRAFEHLFGVEMLEDAVRQWIEGLVGNESGERQAPKFRIRMIKSARG